MVWNCNRFLDFLLQEVKCLLEKVTFDDHLSNELRYADNKTLIAAMFEHFQLSTSQLE